MPQSTIPKLKEGRHDKKKMITKKRYTMNVERGERDGETRWSGSMYVYLN
jgi:hypothetical protein